AIGFEDLTLGCPVFVFLHVLVGCQAIRLIDFFWFLIDHVLDRVFSPTAEIPGFRFRESDESWPPSSLYDRFQSSDGYHVVPPPYTRTFMPPKPDLVFNNAPNGVESNHFSLTVSDSEDESVTKTPQNVSSFVQSTKQVKCHRPSVQHVKTSIPAATPKPASLKPTILTQSKPVPITVIRPVSVVVPKLKGNPQHVLKDKGVIDSGCSRHMTGNMSYLSDFEELNGGYVAFGDDYQQKFLKAKTHVLLIRKASNIEPLAEAVNTACYVQNRVLATKPHNKTPYELLLGRTPSIGFMRPFGCPVTILNTLDSLGKFDRKVDEGFLVGYSNTDGDAAFDGKEPFDEKKPESEVNVSPSSSAQSKKQDDKTKKEDKGKSPVDTNTFSDAGPSNAAASPTHEKSSFIDASKLFNDPDMPELEDITYSDDEDDVRAEADFNNLETSITVSPIPTTRVHIDHLVTQIIGDLSSATQTRSMTRVAKDQGGLSQMFNDDFHTCMFACFLSQEEPKRVHQALKDPSWIEAMQEELL
nr:retrovirus-related Pol polyprotein from transposon TNT 1-94 [Tanacetum cinerariifolium]